MGVKLAKTVSTRGFFRVEEFTDLFVGRQVGMQVWIHGWMDGWMDVYVIYGIHH